MTRVRSFYCLFPRRRGDIPPSPSPSSLPPLPPLYSCLSQTPLLDICFLHSLFFRLHVLFSTAGLLFLSRNPLPACHSTRHPSPLCTLYSACSILHTYVAQDAWWAFLCFFPLIRGWQCHLMPGRHRSRRTYDLQRAESLSGLQDTGCSHS